MAFSLSPGAWKPVIAFGKGYHQEPRRLAPALVREVDDARAGLCRESRLSLDAHPDMHAHTRLELLHKLYEKMARRVMEGLDDQRSGQEIGSLAILL